MSKKTKYNLVVIVAWLIVAGLIIIPRLIFKQPIATATTIVPIAPIATNATNADIVNAIYSLHPAISNIHTAINSVHTAINSTVYTSMGIGVGVILAVMLSRK